VCIVVLLPMRVLLSQVTDPYNNYRKCKFVNEIGDWGCSSQKFSEKKLSKFQTSVSGSFAEAVRL
jgi:hypothetical protein